MKYEGKLSTDVLSDIEDRVSRVRNCLRTSTSAWLEVAREFADAKTKLKSIAFERFVNEVGVTKSIADKLVIVGRRSVLFDEKIIDYISTAEGWTVLYELAKLDDKKVAEVVELVRSNPSLRLTRDLIYNVANNRPLNEKVIVLASIEIDSSKLKTVTKAQSDLIATRLADIDRLLSDAHTLVSYRKRSSSVTRVETAAGANSSPTFVLKTAA
jgi:hypothetical protein